MRKIRPNRIIGRENPVSVADCQADYGTTHDAALRAAEAVTQKAETRAAGADKARTWRGRKGGAR